MNRHFRILLVFIFLIAATLAVIVLNVNTGNVNIPVSSIFKIIVTHAGDPDEVNIIWRIRLPRILMAALLGGALSLSGFLLQTFFRNPIAGPFVLGISSGAKMVVAVMMIVVIGRVGHVSSWFMIIAAFAGSMVATGFIILVSRSVKNMSALLVAGIMIGNICSALTELLITFAEDSDIVNLHNWSQGSFSGMSWSSVRIAFLIVGVTTVLVFLLSKPIGAFQLGEAYAQSMGLNVRRFRVILITLSSVLSACVTAFAGPISFVGIAVPFLMKSALNTAKPLVVVPATFMGGALFCMVCDLIARMALAPSELNISTVTAIFGAPIVIYMLIRRQKARTA
ncbi:MAG: iron ABC transporter permease [Lachnospiraceae bacterium]|nr:iron ABC transporter permease [Lachnospiraceae bacterium]